ncbi:MORN repeat-containing protein 3-like isoform X1 [Culex pipiens pallens]|uniref:MORN repeat-containing protein 3-like isoform X1 n=1 Tax=Culex pipiens pallens TaxID=42434 RepID=UPI001954DEB3|nr:MORN repeat-containing protein 3-like isoform X1 [Culex pipiens pallens]
MPATLHATPDKNVSAPNPFLLHDRHSLPGRGGLPEPSVRHRPTGPAERSAVRGQLAGRHGHGIVYRKEPGTTDLYVKIYVGAWEGGRKHGFGVKYYKRGKYVGFWRRDQRSGRGFMWFDSGNFYMGHWLGDRFDGLGTLLEGGTGNLYQGEFRGGQKHGEGLYVHSRTGQIQRGFWTEGVFRAGTLEDCNRNQVLWPTVYPIPEIKLANFPEIFEEWMYQFSKALQN